MRYIVHNQSGGQRLIYSVRHRAEVFNPNEQREVELSDGTAVQIRRGELRGDKLHVYSTTPEGEAVLEIAHRPLRRRENTLLPPQKQRTGLPPPFVDELEVKDGAPVQPEPAPQQAAEMKAPPPPQTRRPARRAPRRISA